MNTKSIIEEAISLPVEERAIVIDSLLQSLNTPSEDSDREWAAVAQRRLRELREGLSLVSGDVREQGRNGHDRR